ncbi:CLUMA_CG008371, isoform A [Clunio marinus]|uniref:CLUMA_CG008371, isoform A n=1 Tax=Clunio marinus TaxID=568069 RepID=A0A1J1I3G7_9DIPT|nr:CLUMA_CG008371, isoform A [Clunio marinus]
MDKAEKLKAARKKLKEFQTHKHDPKDVNTGSNLDNTQAVQEQPALITFDKLENIQPVASTQDSVPQISSYFGGDSGSAFDIPQQIMQSAEVKDIPVPTFTNEVPFQQFKEQQLEMSTQPFVTPTAFASPFDSEQFQSSKSKIKDLQDQLEQQNYQMTQLKSELDFHRQTAINLQRNSEELNKLRQETQSHVDVVKVLVSEKANLLDSLQKSELVVKAKADENDELQNRLNVSRHRVKQLESEIKNYSDKSFQDPSVETKKLEEFVAVRVKDLKDSNEKIEAERNEIKLLLNQKRIELENLQKNFDHLNTELHLANVKIAQLSDGSTPVDNSNQQINSLNQEIAIKQQQITELYSIIDQVNRDKEASDNQYQNYVSHLTREMETLKENSTELSTENDSLVKREQELLQHVSDLERQIQQQIQKQKTYAEDQQEESTGPLQEELQKLSSQITALTESNESLKAQMSKIEVEKSEIERKFLLKEEEMKNMEVEFENFKTNKPNLSKLMTDFEDKSVAASRALSQNQGLKDQLDEMQRAFITMTNDKMELTDKLQSEMHLCKEMKTRYDSMEVELQATKDKWHYKEDEMIRLSHENTELEKKIMQQNIEIDRLRHYEKVTTSEEIVSDETKFLTNGDENSPRIETNNDEKQTKISVTPSIATEEALEKLQSRFRRTMLEVAELTEEKQRLEHVVTQLQFETETIGEYITLYQYQRRMLKQKEHERDIQLKNLAADREKMNEKLLQLNGLIEKFVLQHDNNIEMGNEATKLLEHESEPIIINPDNRDHQTSKNLMKLKEEPAGKILEILSDIKTVNATSYEPNVGVEHCSCCLGKLETV